MKTTNKKLVSDLFSGIKPFLSLAPADASIETRIAIKKIYKEIKSACEVFYKERTAVIEEYCKYEEGAPASKNGAYLYSNKEDYKKSMVAIETLEAKEIDLNIEKLPYTSLVAVKGFTIEFEVALEEIIDFDK